MKPVVFLLVFSVILGSCTTTKTPYEPTENEEIYGTWVSTEYSGAGTGDPANLTEWHRSTSCIANDLCF